MTAGLAAVIMISFGLWALLHRPMTMEGRW